MRKIWRKLFGTAALALMLCLAGLIMSGEAQARFTDNGNGTVTDTKTNLMWTKNANPFGKLNWDDAMAKCGSFSISGIGGWRLPSRDEQVALYHAIKSGQFLFTGVQRGYYWTSTTDANFTFYAWKVSMVSGGVFTVNKSSTYHVWPVRTGQ